MAEKLRTNFKIGDILSPEDVNRTNATINANLDSIKATEDAATSAATSASNAAQAAEDASRYLSDLQGAIQDLPDGQAVSAEVAQHTVSIGGLEGATTLGQDDLGNDVKPSDILENASGDEYTYVLADGDKHILMGIKPNGEVVLMGKNILQDTEVALEGVLAALQGLMLDDETALTDVESLEDSSEWAKLIQDANGKIIFGIKNDGTVDWSKGVPSVIQDYVTNVLKQNGGGGKYNAFTKYALDMSPLCKPLEVVKEYSYTIPSSDFPNECIVLDSNNNKIA